jgi:UDP-N-acetylglucosamine--N-acetylmuramyl-(pentapeptide) pyrophosphoryl-undecaprenol N-acetylglucosamine transferase
VTGKRYYDDFIKKLEEENIELKDNIQVLKYAYNVPELMVASDMMLSRSGALFLAEIALVGKPSVQIPSPNVAHNHQEFNAKVYEKTGAAIMVTESKVTSEKMINIIGEHLFNEEHLSIMSKNALSLAKPNATEHIMDILVNEIGG